MWVFFSYIKLKPKENIKNKYDIIKSKERWPSGLRRTPGTRVGSKGSRRFESCSLRQISYRALLLFFLIFKLFLIYNKSNG